MIKIILCYIYQVWLVAADEVIRFKLNTTERGKTEKGPLFSESRTTDKINWETCHGYQCEFK